ncbi:hypothetical protein PICMEDRAFT_16774 [Pichia membranifaciens NRRL Y-2026]|uniref:PX domain-containing protein n=1 Tax=Pichia membranifaciens NRRL Y-2026 TaxID=763406 RepID=A0A1E3NLG7_9ASCO|nr:hypothetical protein PICMEDRAFT_16774 [Pichia membranifaciens NRRL Y-2026]ODQ46977.1 hypothetical protein PICMEDRAFT_16774 [Pichia membranifaciens NRRL Y-2026]
MDYDDFSHDNNPFAGSNHFYSNGILNPAPDLDTDEAKEDNEQHGDHNDDGNDDDDGDGDTFATSSLLDDEANTTSKSLPISASEQPTFYAPPPQLHRPAVPDSPTQQPSPYTIRTFEVGKDFKGSKTIFYKIENTINDTFTLRRYNDFKSLRSYLCKFYPYLFIPPIPEKHSISRFLKNPFNYKNDISIIELRIRLLNYFLSKLNSIPQLSNSSITIKFLDPLITNWLNCLKYPPFTNISSNSILLVSTRNPTKPSPYFSFLPIPPLALLKNFNTELNSTVFQKLELNLKIFLKISVNLESKIKKLIKTLHSLRLNMVEFGGFLNIFSIIENQNSKIEKFGNKIDLNFLNIEILINNLIIKIKEPLIILKNSIIYLLQMLHFRKLKELQLVYFQNIILKKQAKLRSLLNSINVNRSNTETQKKNFINMNSSNSPSLNLAIQNMKSTSSHSAASVNSLSDETKQLIKNEIKIMNNDLDQNLIPCFTNLLDDVNFLSTQVEKNVNLEFSSLLQLLTKILGDWNSNVWGEYLTNCLKLWESQQ